MPNSLILADPLNRPGPEELDVKQGQKTSAEQVVLKLRQMEVQTAQGKNLALSFKEAKITRQDYYRRCRNCDGQQIDEPNKVKGVERKNARLRRLLADLSLDKQVLADIEAERLFSIRGS